LGVGRWRQLVGCFALSFETRFFIAELPGFAPASTPQSIELQGFALLHLLQIDVDIAFDAVNVGVARPKLPRAWTGRRRHAAGRAATRRLVMRGCQRTGPVGRQST
jgi:hypothetical protein